jgi:hypothetical protein
LSCSSSRRRRRRRRRRYSPMVKFGHQIAESTYGPWAGQYVRYKALKKLIKLIVAATESLAGSVKTEDVVGKLGGKGLSDSEIGWLLERAEHSGGMVPLEVLEQAFQALLESDLARVAAFSVDQHAHLQSLLADSSPRKDTDTEAEVRERMGRRVEALAHQRLLLAYQDINYIAFFKIAKKHDKVSGGDRMLPVIMTSVEQSSLAKGLLHGSGRTGEYAASLVPAYSGAASSQQIDRATRLSKQAVLTHAPERHFSEHDERLGSLDSVGSPTQLLFASGRQPHYTILRNRADCLSNETRVLVGLVHAAGAVRGFGAAAADGAVDLAARRAGPGGAGHTHQGGRLRWFHQRGDRFRLDHRPRNCRCAREAAVGTLHPVPADGTDDGSSGDCQNNTECGDGKARLGGRGLALQVRLELGEGRR